MASPEHHPTNHEIADAGERQHEISLDNKLAVRGLIKVRSGLTAIDKERTVEYIEELERKLEQAQKALEA